MLCLTRKIFNDYNKQKVIIEFEGKLIEVAVLDIYGKQVKLGIEAPSDVKVHRQEIWEKIVTGE